MALVTASCGVMVRASVAPGGRPASGASRAATLSDDGGFTAFETAASDLVAGDTNGVADVVVRDNRTGTLELVSVARSGGPGDGASTAPVISGNGRYVAFVSAASDLVDGDTNGVTDVFVRDRTAATTTRVSVGPGGAQLPGPSGSVACRSGSTDCTPTEQGVAITDDGHLVVFVATTPGGQTSALLARDLVAATTTTVATSPPAGAGPPVRYTEVALSGDGTTLAATVEQMSPPSPSPTGRGLQVFDTTGGARWVVPPATDAACCHPAVTADGGAVVFTSTRPLAAEDDAGATDDDVFVWDRATGATERVSVRDDGGEIDGGASAPSVSDDGALVAWSSADPSLGIPAGRHQALVRDRVGRRTWVASQTGRGVAGADAVGRLSGDGRTIAVVSAASDLDLASDGNGVSDVFVHTASIPTVNPGVMSVAAGATAVVALSGSGFRSDTSVVSTDPDLRVVSTQVRSSTRIDLTVRAHAGAVAGPARLVLANRGPFGVASETSCDCLSITVPPAPPLGAGRPPDVIVVVTDDQRWDTVDELPLLDARTDWARFDRSFVELPLCCPARASFLTGRSSLRTGVETLRTGHLLDESTTVATMLDRGGYRTAMIGKYLNDYPFGRGIYTPPGWDRFVAWSGGGYTDYQLLENGAVSRLGAAPQDYSTDVLTAEARSFLRSARPDEPVFLYLAYNAPHLDAAGHTPPADRHRGACRDAPVTLPPSYGAHDTVSEPPWMAPLGEPYAPWTIAAIREECAALRSVDEGVASIIDEMDRLGRLDSTYVVLTSDNGYSRGEHRIAGKGHLYDESIRVPLLVRGPDVLAGSVDRLTTNLDLAPTIVDWTGVAAPPGTFDGSSYADTLRGTPGPEPTDVLIRGCRTSAADPAAACGGYPTGMPSNWGIRTERYSYIEYPDGEVQLFDVVSDPWQLTNLGPDPAAAPLIALLHDRLVQRRGW